jgi:prepilin-type N-terminal cleavage/methylation domain-containing protein
MKLHRPCPKARAGRGFTLIEIMMVVAIVGLTLTMGFPAFLRAMRREGMSKAEFDLVKACTEARRAAIMNNERTDLVLHPLDGAFEVPGAFPLTKLPGDVTIDIIGVNFIECKDWEQASVHFFPNGTSDEFTILLRSGGGRVTELDLDTIAALPVLKTIR